MAASWTFNQYRRMGSRAQKGLLGLMLCCSCLEIFNNFIFELVFFASEIQWDSGAYVCVEKTGTT